jgi:putative flippase GtrA
VSTILDHLADLWEQRDTPRVRRLVKYTLVSATSTAVSFLGLLLIFGVFRLWGQVVSTVVANGIATIPSYHLHRRWVWGKGGRSHLAKEILPFWTMAAMGITVSIGGATIARHVSEAYQLGHGVQTVLVLAANITSFAVFWGLKFLLYNRIFHVHPRLELDAIEDLVDAA